MMSKEDVVIHAIGSLPLCIVIDMNVKELIYLGYILGYEESCTPACREFLEKLEKDLKNDKKRK